jgi:hypothetical protein
MLEPSHTTIQLGAHAPNLRTVTRANAVRCDAIKTYNNPARDRTHRRFAS